MSAGYVTGQTYRLENVHASRAPCFRVVFEAATTSAALAKTGALLAVELDGEEPAWGSFADGTAVISASGRQSWCLTKVDAHGGKLPHAPAVDHASRSTLLALRRPVVWIYADADPPPLLTDAPLGALLTRIPLAPGSLEPLWGEVFAFVDGESRYFRLIEYDGVHGSKVHAQGELARHARHTYRSDEAIRVDAFELGGICP